MERQGNARPAVIRRKRVAKGGVGHHGGAWKVAYADFVTAMMAFFLLMWLLNATTEMQRKGLADYFSPTIPINRVSGGGDGAFGGESILSDQGLTQAGVPPSSAAPDPAAAAGNPDDPEGDDARTGDAQLTAVEAELLTGAGAGEDGHLFWRHIVTRQSDKGLIIEVFDLPDAPLFDPTGQTAMPIARQIAGLLAEVLAPVRNRLAVEGHSRAHPRVLARDPAWPVSIARARAMSAELVSAGLSEGRLARITGHGDRKPAATDPAAVRNDRLEVIVLRR